MSLENRVEVPRGNRILDALPPEAYDRLLPALSPVSLELKDLLLESGKAIDTVYFPVSAVVSLLTTMDDGSAVEVATIGNEGIVGVPVFLGAQALGARDFYQVQVPGQVVAMAAGAFLKSTGRDPLRGLVQRYAQALFSQVTQQVACNGLHSIEERCSRWMLLTHDRVGGDEFPLTQEFLAQMLGVRRASVTVAAGILQKAGFIRYFRGRVAIVDRDGLENASCECYRIIRTEFDRLLP
ncbi:MAG TPA: Crp/Fnr family transcriptional regulator [Actinomycetota bacterium]|nr:Crp/Fnr family transcriptional regulator [Acidimicrobiia bacterium]HKN49048.1 Crp/Fnr family transcriptional regulator [Actinomycetota bacterium]HKN91542.1 Crp/Fnr family transcriptional regulator [Acidimicrobiia bacterium]